MSRGIATMFRGTEFRSRGEARWAAMFDQLGWRWTYEPFDGDGYIPDFVIHTNRPFLVEVKSIVRPSDFYTETHKIEASGVLDSYDLIIVGASPIALETQWQRGELHAGLGYQEVPAGMAWEQYFGPFDLPPFRTWEWVQWSPSMTRRKIESRRTR